VAKKEPVNDCRSFVLNQADPAPHMVVVSSQIRKTCDPSRFRSRNGIAEHGPRPRVRQEQMFRRNAAREAPAAQLHFGQDAAAQTHLQRRLFHAKTASGSANIRAHQLCGSRRNSFKRRTAPAMPRRHPTPAVNSGRPHQASGPL
jgi:hypothetical protein